MKIFSWIIKDTSIDFYLKGDLHKICQGYFKVSGSKLSIIKRKMYEYILANKDGFNSNHCTVYIRNSGTKLTWKTVSKIINEELVNNNIIVHMPGGNLEIEIDNDYNVNMTGSVSSVCYVKLKDEFIGELHEI